jgi:hypothetical protein
LQPEYLNHAWYLHQRESLFDNLENLTMRAVSAG